MVTMRGEDGMLMMVGGQSALGTGILRYNETLYPGAEN
jgi:hypothetical protein